MASCSGDTSTSIMFSLLPATCSDTVTDAILCCLLFSRYSVSISLITLDGRDINIYCQGMSFEDLTLAERIGTGKINIQNVPLGARKKLLEDLPAARRVISIDDVTLDVRRKIPPGDKRLFVAVERPATVEGKPPVVETIGVIGAPGSFRTLADVRKAAETIMAKYVPGWVFRFDKSSSRAGACSFRYHMIKLSERYCLSTRVPDKDVLDTILHEVAHALAGPKAAHGPIWKKMAMDIGCTGHRCHSFSFSTARYKLKCPCGAVDTYRTRVRKEVRLVCTKCKDPVKVTNTGVRKTGVRH